MKQSIIKAIELDNGETVFGLDKLTAQYTYNEIYKYNVYFQNGIEIKDGDTVLDIGANIGLFTRFITGQYQDLTVYTFEPVDIIFQALKKNLEKCRGNIVNNRIGLSDQTGEAQFYFYPKVSADSALEPVDLDRKIKMFTDNYETTAKHMFPATRLFPRFLLPRLLKLHRLHLYQYRKVTGVLTTLSNVIDEHRIQKIDLLKVDAENHERHVLRGLRREHWPIIRQISMEVHGHIKGGENLVSELSSMLIKYGFRVEVDWDDPLTKVGVYMMYARR